MFLLLSLTQDHGRSSRRLHLQNQSNPACFARSHYKNMAGLRAPLPDPGMHWGVGPALHLGRKMAASGVEPQILVQYLVLRKDLSQAPFSWPAGAVVAQACHAATAALHLHRDHPYTAAYLRELGRMRKVVLEAADETTLKELAETLQQNNIDHMLWLEQPENIATCIALRPYPKEEVNQYLKRFRLFK